MSSKYKCWFPDCNYETDKKSSRLPDLINTTFEFFRQLALLRNFS